MLTSLSNPKIKDAVKLRDGKYRRAMHRFIIDGQREIDRAIQSGIRINSIFYAGNVPPYSAEYLLYEVSEPVLQKLSFGDRNEGILAVAEEPERTPDVLDKASLLAVLEGIEKPGNIGAAFRSADGAGIGGIILAGPLTDLYHPNIIRNSLGTVFSVPAVSMDSADALRYLRNRKVHCALAKCGGAVNYTEYNFNEPTAIVLGSESNGLSGIWQGNGTTAITLPMDGIADSLNVSAAAAVLFYEAHRQRCLSRSGTNGYGINTRF